MPDQERDEEGGEGGEAGRVGRRTLPPPEPLRLQAPLGASEDGRYHVSQLLSFHDRTFVEAAIAAAFARRAEPAEAARALAELRTGRRTKLEIIEDLIGSPEGREARADERIAGLKRKGLSHRLRGLPVVGGVWRVLALVARLPLLARNQQEFEAYTAAQLQLLTDQINAPQRWVADLVNVRLEEVVAHVNSLHGDVVSYVNGQRQLSADYVNEQRQTIHDYINEELRPALADAAEAVSMLSDALAAMRAHVGEQQSRINAQEELIVQEQQVIVEAQKATLAQIEGRLSSLLAESRESIDGQGRALAELSGRVEALRAAVEAARRAAGEGA